MKGVFTKFIIGIFLLWNSSISYAQTKFYSNATPQHIAIGDYFTYNLIVENAVTIEKINFPDFSNCEVLSGPIQEKHINTVNDRVYQTITLIYVLQPKKVGTITIEAVTAFIDGRGFKAAPVNVVVENASTNLSKKNAAKTFSQTTIDDIFNEQNDQVTFDDYKIKNGETIPKKVSANMQLVLKTTKMSCYIGEPILATYKLYSRLDCESEWLKIPAFTGFSVIDMLTPDNEIEHTQEKLNGKLYNVYDTRKAQLYPLQSGKIEIETATLTNKVGFQQNGNLITQKVNLISSPLSITVLPLPEAGKPKNFNGAVGEFSIETSLEKNTIASNESGKLILSITGSGNMQLLTLPKMLWPTSFDVFDTKIIDNINQNTMPLSGTKSFEVPFSITKEGKYTLPAIEFSYFNPATKAYKTVFSTPQNLSVVHANTNSINNLNVNNPIQNDFYNNRFWGRLFVFGSLLIGLIVLLVYFFKHKKVKNQTQVLHIDYSAVSKNEDLEDAILFSNTNNYLEKTYACLQNNNCATFYEILNSEFKSLLALKYKLTKDQINANTIGNLLDTKSLQNDIVLKTQNLLSEIELKLYTPFERNESLQGIYDNAQALVQAHIQA